MSSTEGDWQSGTPTRGRAGAMLFAVLAVALLVGGIVAGSGVLDEEDSGDLVVERATSPPPTPPAPGVGTVQGLPPAPIQAREEPVAAWSGAELVVWGGFSDDGTGPVPLDDGAAFDPDTGAWRALPAAPIGGRLGPASVWAGDRLFIWGGMTVEGASPEDVQLLGDGAVYGPEDRWELVPAPPIEPRLDPLVEWSGAEVLVLGGRHVAPSRAPRDLREGAAYDPVAGSWRLLGAPPDEVYDIDSRSGAWVGDRLVVWTGADLAAYDPVVDDWTLRELPPVLTTGTGQLVALDEHRVAILHAAPMGQRDRYGLVFDMRTDALTALPTGDLRRDRDQYNEALATDRGLILVGGGERGDTRNRPQSKWWGDLADQWHPLPPQISERERAAAVWTGQDMLLWGGTDHVQHDGLRWRPPDEPVDRHDPQ